MDDARVTSTKNQKNILVEQGFKGIPKIFNSRYKEVKNGDEEQILGYRPVGRSTFAIEWQLWGQKPHVAHFINILLYALACCILFYLLKTTVFRNQPISLPIITTLLFMAHPVHSEVVASLKNREEILAFLFGELALLAFWKYMSVTKPQYLLLASILYLAATFSKESAIIFWGLTVMVIYFFHPNKDSRINYPSLAVALAIFALHGIVIKKLDDIIPAIVTFISMALFRFKYSNLTAIFVVVFYLTIFSFKLPHTFLPAEVNINTFWENPLQGGSLNITNHITLILNTYYFYFKLFLFPYPLCFYYGYNTVAYESIFSITALLIIAIFIGIGYLFVKNFNKNKVLAFALAGLVWSLMLFSNLFPVPGIVAERLAFIAILPFSILLTMGIIELNKRYAGAQSKNLYFIVGPIILIYFFVVFNRNKDWYSVETLYTHDVKYLENSAKANSMFALMQVDKAGKEQNPMVKKQLYKSAIKHFEIALKVYPTFSEPLNQLGRLYYNIGNFDKALYYYTQNYTKNPKNKGNALSIGAVHHAMGNFSKAKQYYNLAIANDTLSATPYLYLADIYLIENKIDSVNYLLNQANLKKISHPEFSIIREKANKPKNSQ